MCSRKSILVTFAILLGVLCPCLVHAKTLEQIGLDFLSKQLGGEATIIANDSAKSLRAKTPNNMLHSYEVVNAKVNGKSCFAIVLETKGEAQVVGYSDSSNIQELPEALVALLSGKNENCALSAAKEASYTPVAPMLTTKWGQCEPYNLKAPMVEGEHGVAGCVAVAMAQVLNYWHSDKPGYDCIEYVDNLRNGGSNAEIFVDFSQSCYDWNLMLDDYSNGYTDAQAQEVARLMFECGAASASTWRIVNQYNNGTLVTSSKATTAYDPFVALNRYYNFNCSYLCRKYTATPIFMQVVRDELYAGRPVIYSGMSSSNGHSFVVDGLDAQGFGHINWGWNGEANGYYDLNFCMPSNATTSDEAYDSGQNLVYNIRPRTADEKYRPAYELTGYMPHPEVTIYTGTNGVTTNFYSPGINTVGTTSTEAKFYGFCWIDCETGEIANKAKYQYYYNTNQYSYFPNYSSLSYFSASGGRYDGVWLPANMADGEYYFTTCYTNEDETEFYPSEVLMANTTKASVKDGNIKYYSFYGETGQLILNNIVIHNPTAKGSIFMDIEIFEDSYDVDAHSHQLTFTLQDINSDKAYSAQFNLPSAYAASTQSLRFSLDFAKDNGIKIPEGAYRLDITSNSNIEIIYDEIIVDIQPQLEYPLMISSTTEWDAELSKMGAVAIWNGGGGYCKPQDSQISIFNRWYSCNKMVTPIDINFYTVSVNTGKEYYLTTYKGYVPKEYNPMNWIYPDGNLYPLVGDFYIVARYMTPDGEKSCAEPWYNPYVPGALFTVTESSEGKFHNLVINDADANIDITNPIYAVNVTNCGKSDFNGTLQLILRNLSDGRVIESYSDIVEIAAGETGNVSFSIEGLNDNDCFAASLKSIINASRAVSSPTAVLNTDGEPVAFSIKGFDPAGIEEIETNGDNAEVRRYNLMGISLSQPIPGINIIVYKNGSVKKVIVK